ncbi:hypothetical protein [Ectopseudomonas guguanensis]|uniref:Uncharacterized protein n=1 Tax=Ectopseudomonas guguanensis TaxID=1198456 RepID=A0A1H0TNF2_9GAMM|nr:hypothetical protein [Pseudomonas guguanensis]SDP55295.1 hypothetical protein SAMN05216213_104218 [Pseudomonas guguanensis]
MFNKIYLHIGLPKTGTSYLQNALDALSREGELLRTSYPVLNTCEDHTRIQSGNGEAIAFQLLVEKVPDFCVQTVARLTAELLAKADQSKANLLISSEHFSNADPERMVHVLDILKAHAISVEVLVFVRPIDRLCYSRYHQEVKRHAESRVYGAEFFESFSSHMLQQVELIGNLPCVTHIFDYKAGGLLAVLLEFLGEDSGLHVPFTDQTVNRSLTELELKLLRQINAIFKKPELSTRISDRWIYANPQAPSMVDNTDPEQLVVVLRQLISEQGERFAAPVCLAMLERLLAVTGGARSTEENKSEAVPVVQPDIDGLMQMALEEIFNSMHIEEQVSEYAKQLLPTRDVFDPVHYLLLNRDVLAAGVDPILHFKQFGRKEGRFSSFSSIGKIFD